jgi:hypothetical protein
VPPGVFVKGRPRPVRDQGLRLHEVYAVCSIAGDLTISEIVEVPN